MNYLDYEHSPTEHEKGYAAACRRLFAKLTELEGGK